jgi:hypothetical protein
MFLFEWSKFRKIVATTVGNFDCVVHKSQFTIHFSYTGVNHDPFVIVSDFLLRFSFILFDFCNAFGMRIFLSRLCISRIETVDFIAIVRLYELLVKNVL